MPRNPLECLRTPENEVLGHTHDRKWSIFHPNRSCLSSGARRSEILCPWSTCTLITSARTNVIKIIFPSCGICSKEQLYRHAHFRQTHTTWTALCSALCVTSCAISSDSSTARTSSGTKWAPLERRSGSFSNGWALFWLVFQAKSKSSQHLLADPYFE